MAGITWAMDLTPLVTAPAPDVTAFTLAFVERLRTEVAVRLGAAGPSN